MAKGWGDSWRGYDPTTRSITAAAPAKRNRWSAKPCIVTIGGEIFELAIAKKLQIVGVRCGSLFEANRVVELILEQKAGLITDLTLQRSYPLSYPSPTGPIVLGNYIADAVYLRAGVLVVEDAKGMPGRTAIYSWKRRHFEAQYAPLTITEVVT